MADKLKGQEDENPRQQHKQVDEEYARKYAHLAPSNDNIYFINP